MDSRRHLIRRPAARLLGFACASLLLSGCGTVKAWLSPGPAMAPPEGAVSPVSADPLPVARVAATPAPLVAAAPVAAPAAPRPLATMAPIPNPPATRPRPAPLAATGAATPPQGRAAIAVANRRALAPSRSEAFVGGVQVFDYDASRLFEVWTAPLRVTTLTLAPGETVVSKAAGDTVRWQIGETTSGDGGAQRAHVMIKPLQRGLETNLVIATSQRVYQLLLRSGPPESFNAVVTWNLGERLPLAAVSPAATPSPSEPSASSALASSDARSALTGPAGVLDARYRIAARGRTPPWAPTAVMTDGVRTFLAFPASLPHGEAPALFVRGVEGAVQLVNYRQQSGLWVVDRVVEQGELRLGDRPREVVHFVRLGGRS